MFYADGTQLHVTFHPADLNISVAKLEVRIRDVRLPMCRNFLRLNDEKTEVIIFRASPLDHINFDSVSLPVGEDEISTNSVVRVVRSVGVH